MSSSTPESPCPPPSEEGVGVLRRLQEAGLAPRGRRDQHFLHDPRLLRAVAEDAAVVSGDAVFEVGTGPGTLTRELAARAREVLTVEVDPRMLDFARAELAGVENVRWLRADVLDGRRVAPAVIEALGRLGPFAWVANLPYGVASPLVVAMLESGLPWLRAYVLVQEEVAARLTAPPGVRAYGPLGLLVAFWARAQPGRSVSPRSFVPPPRVQSRFVRLDPIEPLGTPEDYAGYRWWVRQLFGARRKQLGGLLRSALGEQRAEQLLGELGWDPRSRPGELSPGRFLELARREPPPEKSAEEV